MIMDKAEPVVIARAWTESEASVIKSLLESYDIPSHYASEIPNRFYPLRESAGPIRIFVPSSLAQEAENILEEHRRQPISLRLVEADPE
jgi:hypothetical protein